MAHYAAHLRGEPTQFDRTDPRQIPNSEGAMVFDTGPFERLERFLILGAEGGTYYARERQLTRENASCIAECVGIDAARTVRAIVDVSQWGRAPKQAPALFALALVAANSDPVARKAALAAVPLVCRTASHLFEFVSIVDGLRGWGSGLCKAVGSWYASKAPEQLGYQLIKYRQRSGWSHRDVLRQAHPDHGLFGPQQKAMIRWAVRGELGERSVVRRKTEKLDAQPAVGDLPEQIAKFEELQRAATVEYACQLIREQRFTHEMVPDRFKGERAIWEALLPNLPLGALVRNLGKLTAIGILAPGSDETQTVAQRLVELGAIRKARLHPIAFLSAQMVYRQGHGEKGKLSWTAAPAVTEALESAFYLAFGNVKPVGKPLCLALDVSGSMQSGTIAGVPGLTPAMATAALALVTMRTEREAVCMGFSHRLEELAIHGDMKLAQAMKQTERPFGNTDCSLPLRWAKQNARRFAGFGVYTDSETNSTTERPELALRAYRQASGIPARLAVVAFTATKFTIADPKDAGMLDVVGFDSGAPAVLSDFFRGKRHRAATAEED